MYGSKAHILPAQFTAPPPDIREGRGSRGGTDQSNWGNQRSLHEKGGISNELWRMEIEKGVGG